LGPSQDHTLQLDKVEVQQLQEVLEEQICNSEQVQLKISVILYIMRKENLIRYKHHLNHKLTYTYLKKIRFLITLEKVLTLWMLKYQILS
jgi:hypothetical protein